MGSGLDVKIFFLLQPAGVGQGVATPLVGAFHHHFLQSLSNRFLMRQRGTTVLMLVDWRWVE